MSLRARAFDLWRAFDLYCDSPFTDYRRRRPMAYIVDFQTWDALRLERSDDMVSCFDAFAQTLFGWPIYIGPYAPPDGILFLPERTVRSMAGIVPA